MFKKIPIAGGTSVPISNASNPLGASWGSDDNLLIGAGPEGILRVSANGGKPETIIKVQQGELAEGPQLLPDGEHILFTLAKDSNWANAQIAVHSLKSGQNQVVFEGGTDARYLSTGHIVYSSSATLFGIPFDARKLRVAGGPVAVLADFSPGNYASNVAISPNGSIAYVTGTVINTATSEGTRLLALVDRNGVRKPLPLAPARYLHPRVSPDGKHLAIGTDDGKEAIIWLYEIGGASAMRRLTFGSNNRWPIWSRDGQRVIFQSDREGDIAIFSQRLDGSDVQRLTKPETKRVQVPISWSSDGKTLMFTVGANNAGSKIWSVMPGTDSRLTPFGDTASLGQSNSSVSPDGRWIAYTHADAGAENQTIYVEPFPTTGVKYQITRTRSVFPVWSPDNKQLFFAQNNSGIGNIMSVDIQTKNGFSFSNPQALPIKRIMVNGGEGLPRGYDIFPDGKQFIVMLDPAENDSPQRQQINVVLNWFTELKQRVPIQ
jgi:serine/threonine-protein kinase